MFRAGALVGAGAVLLASIIASDAFAGDHARTRGGSRASLANKLVDDSKKDQPIYQSSPVTHIVPSFNTVTYAADAHLWNTEVHPDQGGTGEEMRVEGYSVEPYLVLSLKRIGLGFNVTSGHKEIAYASASSLQESRIDYRGIGAFGFFKIHDTHDFYSTLILGGRNLSARHEVGEARYDSSARGRTYDYGLMGYETGLNAGFRLSRSFTVIPWANYSYVDDSRGRSLADRDSSATMEEDLDLFWKTGRPFNYGLDFAVRVTSFEVRVGGLLGLALSDRDGSEGVTDRSYSLSLAWDQSAGF